MEAVLSPRVHDSVTATAIDQLYERLVEIGQLLFIAVVLAAIPGLRRLPLPAWAWRIPVYSIGGLAAFWTIDGIAGF